MKKFPFVTMFWSTNCALTIIDGQSSGPIKAKSNGNWIDQLWLEDIFLLIFIT